MGIREAAKILGVSVTTLRRWKREGRLVPEHTTGGHRRDRLSELRPEYAYAADVDRKSLAYAGVSSPDQKDDREGQKAVLESYCARQGGTFELIADLGSGMNDHKKGLKRLLDAVVTCRIGLLIIAHK